MASHVEVSFSGDMVTAQSSNHLHGVLTQEVVVMVAPAMGMHEDHDIGQVVVVIDDVGQVDHNFVTFVSGRVEGRFGVVGNVDGYVDVG